MNKPLFLLTVCVFLAQSLPVSGQAIDKNAAKQEGGQLGTSLNSSIYQNIKTGDPNTVVPSYNTNPNQTQYFQGGQGSTVTPGSARVAGCKDQNDLECQAVNLLKQGPVTRPQFDLKRDDPLLTRGKDLTADPSKQIGDIFSSYDSCKTTTVTTPPTFETQICNEFSVTENLVCKMGQDVVIDPDYLYKCLETIQSQANRTCEVGRVVVVDADYNYQCEQSPKKIETVTCNKFLLVTCDPLVDGCDNGGIVPGSTQGDMRVYFGPVGGGTYGLEFGTISDNYWGTGEYDRTLTFDILNKEQITQFQLAGAYFDDWLLVQVNGVTVYVGPYGGDRLEIFRFKGSNFVRYSGCSPYPYGGCSASLERSTSWAFSLGVDLRPYLINGRNTIFTRTLVGGFGESAIRINARMNCPRNCYDNWDNQCSGLESRAQ